MSRDSAARTSLFVHIWIAKLSIGKYQRLHDRSTRLHPAAVSRSQLHSLACHRIPAAAASVASAAEGEGDWLEEMASEFAEAKE